MLIFQNGSKVKWKKNIIFFQNYILYYINVGEINIEINIEIKKEKKKKKKNSEVANKRDPTKFTYMFE